MYHIYEEFNYYYIVTELCYGRELFDELKEVKHFSEPEAAAIFIQIVSACRYLHSRKVMHRDLKPENIFYDRERKILKLLDFGSAVWYESAEPTRRRVVGTVTPHLLSHITWPPKSSIKSTTTSVMSGRLGSSSTSCCQVSPPSREKTTIRYWLRSRKVSTTSRSPFGAAFRPRPRC